MTSNRIAPRAPALRGGRRLAHFEKLLSRAVNQTFCDRAAPRARPANLTPAAKIGESDRLRAIAYRMIGARKWEKFLVPLRRRDNPRVFRAGWPGQGGNSR